MVMLLFVFCFYKAFIENQIFVQYIYSIPVTKTFYKNCWLVFNYCLHFCLNFLTIKDPAAEPCVFMLHGPRGGILYFSDLRTVSGRACAAGNTASIPVFADREDIHSVFILILHVVHRLPDHEDAEASDRPILRKK